MTAPDQTSKEPSPELIQAIAAFLLLSAHEGGGPYGRLSYAIAQAGEPLPADDGD